MPKLSQEEVAHIAKLSRLELSKEEEEKFSSQLSSVLEYVSLLDEVKIEGVDPLNNVTGLENVYAADIVDQSEIEQSDISKNAPKFEDGFFQVPGVFE